MGRLRSGSHTTIRDTHLRTLFAEDPGRGERFTAEGAGLYLDYSKHRITQETLRLLVQLADECALRERIEAMFTGEKINVTEGRAVLHVALRAPKGESIFGGKTSYSIKVPAGESYGHVENPKEPERVVAWLRRLTPGTFVSRP